MATKETMMMQPIDANSFLNTIKTYQYILSSKYGSTKYGMFTDDIERIINEMPRYSSVYIDKAEIRGDLVWYECRYGNPSDGYDYEYGWKCDTCKRLFEEYDDEYSPPNFNYCSHCGVKFMSTKDSMR